MTAPNIVWIDSLAVQQSILVFRMKSLQEPATYVATILPPDNGQFSGVAVGGDDRTFIAESVMGNRIPARFYELQLDSAGRPGPLIRLRFGQPEVALNSMVVTPDGRKIAGVVGHPGRWGIAVISTASGRQRTWTWRGPVPQYLAWSGDHAIDFVTSVPAGTGSRTNPKSSLYRLSTASQGGDLATSRVLVAQFARFGSLTRRSPWLVTDLQVTRNGRTALAALSSGAGNSTRQVILRMSALTGRPMRVLTRPAVGWSHDGIFCDTLWSDGSGRHLLVSCGPYSGRVDNGRFTAIRHFEPTQYLLTGFAPFAW